MDRGLLSTRTEADGLLVSIQIFPLVNLNVTSSNPVIPNSLPEILFLNRILLNNPRFRVAKSMTLSSRSLNRKPLGLVCSAQLTKILIMAIPKLIGNTMTHQGNPGLFCTG